MRLLRLFLLLALLLAGCSQGGPRSEPTGDGSAHEVVQDLELRATAVTGILVGVVVDDRIRPLQDAQVVLSTGEATRTNADGNFGFDGLPSGDYLVTASKDGHATASVAATVIAGEELPRMLQLMLPFGPSTLPFVEAARVEGYIQCGGNPVALCAIPNNYRPTACGIHPLLCYDNVTEDRARFNLEFTGNLSAMQGELLWDASTQLSRQLAWKAEQNVDCDGVGGTNTLVSGTSPLLSPPVPRALREPGGEPCGVIVVVAAGAVVEGGCVPGVPLFGQLCPGVTVQQPFQAFVHAFYRHLPPEDWRFSRDGAPDVLAFAAATAPNAR